MERTSPASYFGYWGKAEKSSGDHHVLAFHCLDAAAVAAVILEWERRLASQLARLLGLSLEAVASLAAFLVGLHDAGKFSLRFQSLLPDLLVRLQPDRQPSALTSRHQDLGMAAWRFILLPAWLEEGWLGLPDKGHERDMLEALFPAVAGHHGRPLDSFPEQDRLAKRAFPPRDRESLLAYARDLARVVDPGGKALAVWSNPPARDRVSSASWLLAGLCVLADWLASDPEYFAFDNQPKPLEERWPVSLEMARRAVAASGVAGAKPASFRGFSSLFGDRRPHPMQALAEEVNIASGPQLFILEDTSGSGKTEAALTLAARLMGSRHGNGLYLALPTMATADAMYGRLGKVYRRLFTGEGRPSLVLAHSKRHLVDEFCRSVEIAAPSTRPLAEKEDTAVCAAWLAQSNKRALLAQVGVGTLDQALTAVMPVRHQSLKLLGLCRGILIADEVHAYDPYMTQILEGLLRFQAALGGSAILLSATLPLDLRIRLVQAFREGLHVNGGEEPRSMAYPLLTHVHARGMEEVSVPPSGGQVREICVELVHDPGRLAERLCQAARGGACVCWVRNTVDDALEAYRTLAAELGQQRVTLFHARLAMVDRLAVEAEVLSCFGPGSTPERRAGRVLVATQVVEQSLDLDFDLMASDLAPMDLVIQRLGRLQRHHRPERPLHEARLLLLSPSPEDEPTRDWYARFFPRGRWVYRHHGRLWLTCRVLARKARLRLPEQSRELIEAVFAPASQAAIPTELREVEEEQMGDDLARRAIAQGWLLQPRAAYGKQYLLWDEDVATRLDADTVTLRLARWQGGRLLPWAREADPQAAWELSEVNVRATRVAGEAPPGDPDLARAMEEAKAAMPDQCRWSKLVPLVPGGEGIWYGEVRDHSGRTRKITYHPRLGLSFP